MKLVLLPGMDGTGDLFDPVLSNLPEEIEPIVVTYPGSEPLDYEDLVEIAREAIPAEEPYAILGESFSGPIAVSLAAGAGTNLVALFLCCTFVRNPSIALAAMRPILPLIPMRNFLADTAANFLLGARSIELKESVVESLDKVHPRVLRKRIREVLDVDVSQSLGRVTVPIQYLQASRDWIVSIRSAQLICSIAPATEIYRIDGPHLLLQSQPEQAARAISGFLARLAVTEQKCQV